MNHPVELRRPPAVQSAPYRESTAKHFYVYLRRLRLYHEAPGNEWASGFATE